MACIVAIKLAAVDSLQSLSISEVVTQMPMASTTAAATSEVHC